MQSTAEAPAITSAPAGTPGTTGKRGPRGPRGAKSGEDKFLYCIDTGKGESGTIVLSKPGDKKVILAAAIKHGVPFYRLQKFSVSVEVGDGDTCILVESPAE